MEQLECLLTFPLSRELEELDFGAIWGSDERAAWISDVEASPGFTALRHAAAKLSVHQEPV
jgi:hypothetical protein